MEPGSSPLLIDLYQLNMIEAYLAHGESKTAVFELFVRQLPTRRGFLMAAGLEQALEYLEHNRHISDLQEFDGRVGKCDAPQAPRGPVPSPGWRSVFDGGRRGQHSDL